MYQGPAQLAQPSLGSGALTYPPATNPTQQTLANVAELWGYRRDLWTPQSGAVIGGQIVYPVARTHLAATLRSDAVCSLHFVFDGPVFEILFAGTNVEITLIADGQYMASRVIRTSVSGGIVGAPLSAPNAFVGFDFGSSAVRHVSIYARSSQGPCAIAIGANNSVQAWDRSSEASFGAMADSYGAGPAPNWGIGGPFWEAAALLGIPNVDLDAIGGSGYAPNGGNTDTRNIGNAFPARLPTCVNAMPDLFLTAGGINDNNSLAVPGLYATPADALAGFNTGVQSYYTQLRAALPDSVLVATGPWKPNAADPGDPIPLSKSDTIKTALQSAGGAWVFLDNLHGGWVASSGASAPATGPWQTGTGNSAHPTGDGNGDLYLDFDGVHPNEAGCFYLGSRIANDVRAALLTL